MHYLDTFEVLNIMGRLKPPPQPSLQKVLAPLTTSRGKTIAQRGPCNVPLAIQFDSR